MEEDVKVSDLLNVIWKRKLFIFLITLASGLVSGFLAFFVLPEVYETEISLLILKAESPTQQNLINPIKTAHLYYDSKTFKQIILSEGFLRKMKNKLGFPATDLKDKVKIKTPTPNFIRILVQDKNPQMAQKIANKFTQELVLESKRIQQFHDEEYNKTKGTLSVGSLKILYPAFLPEDPVKPNKSLIVGTSMVLGFMAGILLALLI